MNIMGIKLKEPMIVNLPTKAMFQKDEARYVDNPSFYPCSVRVMAINTVANRMSFGEEPTLNALPTLSNIPLVTLFKEEINDFGDHEMYRDETGRYRYNTYPIGMIPESANQWIEKVEDSEGVERLYLCSDAILWKRQHREFAKIKEMEQMSVSMEVQITSGEFSEDNILNVGSFYFTAIAVLGENVQPAFRDALVRTFTEDTEYQVMMSELKEYMKQFEGGNGMPKAKPSNFTPEGGEGQEPNNQPTNGGQPDNGQEPDNGANTDPVDYKALYEQLKGEIETIKSDSEKAEAEFGRTISELTGEKTNLETQIQQLQTDNDSKVKELEDELADLRAYKAEADKVQREAFRNDIIERFGDLQEVDEFKELLTKIDSMNPQDVEDKCYAIVGRQARAGKKPKAPVQPTRIPVTTPTNDKPRNDGYNGLLLKRK